MFPGFCDLEDNMRNYLLENWEALLAFFKPYFNRLSDDFP